MKISSLNRVEFDAEEIRNLISDYIEKKLGWYATNINFVYDVDEDTGKASVSGVEANNGPINVESPKENRRQKYVDKYGEKIVDEAEGYYETDFDKNFWYDLDDYDVMDYIIRAKWHLVDKLRSED